MVQLDRTDDDRPAAADHAAKGTPQVDRCAKVPHRGERVGLELPDADRGEAVERERHVREVTKEGQTDVAPVDPDVQVLVDRGLHSGGDAILEQERRRQQEEHDEQERAGGDGEKAGGFLHEVEASKGGGRVDGRTGRRADGQTGRRAA